MEKTRHVYLEPIRPGSLEARLEEMRLQGVLCDITIQVENVEFPAHRLVLAAKTKYFENMFLNNFQESNSKIIVIKDVSVTNMRALLTFIYTGEITFTETNVQDLIKDADYLELLNLKEEGIEFFLESCLNVDIAYDSYRLAERLGFTTLLEGCMSFIRQHFQNISSTEYYLDLDVDLLNNILSGVHVKASAEERFDAVMRWVLNDVDERKSNLPKLLECINCSFINNKFLTDYFSKGELESIEHKHSDLVADIMSFYECRKQDSCGNEKYIIAIDCGDSNDMEIYDPASDTWQPITAVGHFQEISGAIMHEKKLYAVGDHGIQVYEPQNKMWESKSPMRFKRSVTNIVALHDFLYVCGGHIDNECDVHSFDTVERYCPKDDKWEIMTPMNCDRLCHAVVALEGYIYAIGGNEGYDHLKSVERYDPRVNKWTMVKYMRKREDNFGAAVLNGKIYVCGGRNKNSEARRTVEMYDPDTDRWEFVARMKTARYCFSVVAYMDKLWAIGGQNDDEELLTSVEVYDPVSNSWRDAKPINEMGLYTTCAVVSKL